MLLIYVCTGKLIVQGLFKQIPSSNWLSVLRADVGAKPGARDPDTEASTHEKKTEYYQHISRAMTGLFLPDVGFDAQW